jgi:hypothetical protein
MHLITQWPNCLLRFLFCCFYMPWLKLRLTPYYALQIVRMKGTIYIMGRVVTRQDLLVVGETVVAELVLAF